jgi:serine/threonine protein phosphatase 1
MGLFSWLFGLRRRADAEAAAPSRIVVGEEPAVIYAVGDVHGCLSLLRRLETQIVEDAAAVAGEKWIVMIGDYVDRGPESAQVIDHLLSPPPEGFRRFCLAGNHEAEMANFMRAPSANSSWLGFGGRETLLSYGIPEQKFAAGQSRRALQQVVASYVPAEHLQFIARLPAMLETPHFVFVHAGLRPGIATADQALQDLLWYRDDFAETYLTLGKTVVHGHTIRDEVLITPGRIAIDTGAYAKGRLSAVRLAGGKVSVIEATTS